VWRRGRRRVEGRRVGKGKVQAGTTRTLTQSCARTRARTRTRTHTRTHARTPTYTHTVCTCMCTRAGTRACTAAAEQTLVSQQRCERSVVTTTVGTAPMPPLGLLPHLHGLHGVLDALDSELGLLHVELLVVEGLPLPLKHLLLPQHLERILSGSKRWHRLATARPHGCLDRSCVAAAPAGARGTDALAAPRRHGRPSTASPARLHKTRGCLATSLGNSIGFTALCDGAS
jgi:hypothetical protein